MCRRFQLQINTKAESRMRIIRDRGVNKWNCFLFLYSLHCRIVVVDMFGTCVQSRSIVKNYCLFFNS